MITAARPAKNFLRVKKHIGGDDPDVGIRAAHLPLISTLFIETAFHFLVLAARLGNIFVTPLRQFDRCQVLAHLLFWDFWIVGTAAAEYFGADAVFGKLSFDFLTQLVPRYRVDNRPVDRDCADPLGELFDADPGFADAGGNTHRVDVGIESPLFSC